MQVEERVSQLIQFTQPEHRESSVSSVCGGVVTSNLELSREKHIETLDIMSCVV